MTPERAKALLAQAAAATPGQGQDITHISSSELIERLRSCPKTPGFRAAGSA